MSILGTIREDVTTDVLGKIGTWQWLVTFVSLLLMMPALFNQYEDVFMLNPDGVMCIPPQALAVLNSSLCSVIVIANGTNEDILCNKWNVKLVWFIWLKKSWLLFCEHKLKLLSTAVICRFGLVFGCVIFGSVADSFGRKTALYVGIGTSSFLELVLTFCDSQGWYRLFVFLKSLSASASLYMGLLLTCEIASNRWRSALNTIVMTPRLLATVCAVPLASTAPNTETYALVSCIYGLICVLILRCCCPESPQWFLHNRKINRAEITLKKAAIMNGIQLCKDFKIRPVNQRAYHCLDEPTTCVGLLTIPNTRFIFLVMSLFWAVYYFLWSSLYVESCSTEISGGLLLKIFCFVLGFGCLTIIASKRLSFRHLLMIHIILTGTTTIITVCVRKGTVHIVTSSLALSVGIIVHSLILNITPRLFATNIRGIAFGCCHASGHFGSIVGYIIFLFHPMHKITFLVLVTIAILALVGLCLVLPDVDGRELPDVLEDMDYYSELTKPLRWATQRTNSPSIEEIEMRVYSFGSGQVASNLTVSDARVPAERIGYSSLWWRMVQHLRRKFARRK